MNQNELTLIFRYLKQTNAPKPLLDIVRSEMHSSSSNQMTTNHNQSHGQIKQVDSSDTALLQYVSEDRAVIIDEEVISAWIDSGHLYCELESGTLQELRVSGVKLPKSREDLDVTSNNGVSTISL